jgi:hypothetical protein
MNRKDLKKLIREVVKQIDQINETFDVQGKNPKAYFHVNNWAWRPLMELIDQVNDTFNLNIKDLDKWHSNDGYGLDTQEECNKLADALEHIIKNQPYNKTVRMKNLPPLAASLKNTYGIDIGTVVQFIKFLRECNGFEVW